ncbi:hypothetical protein CLOM_g10511 [Closterium sp. NIES-68]|nr:hypothetical protein CLOM_g10511 [Closterium sp. NIES-68]
MRAVRATFLCLSLNFTLCSIFNGRHYTGRGSLPTSGLDDATSAETGSDGGWTSSDPSGFLLMDSRQICSHDQWSRATRGLIPSLEALTWSSALCEFELRLLAALPPRPASIRAASAGPLADPAATCLRPYVRKGTKLYSLSPPPTPSSTTASSTAPSAPPPPCHTSSSLPSGRLAGLDLCVLLHPFPPPPPLFHPLCASSSASSPSPCPSPCAGGGCSGGVGEGNFGKKNARRGKGTKERGSEGKDVGKEGVEGSRGGSEEGRDGEGGGVGTGKSKEVEKEKEWAGRSKWKAGRKGAKEAADNNGKSKRSGGGGNGGRGIGGDDVAWESVVEEYVDDEGNVQHVVDNSALLQLAFAQMRKKQFHDAITIFNLGEGRRVKRAQARRSREGGGDERDGSESEERESGKSSGSEYEEEEEEEEDDEHETEGLVMEDEDEEEEEEEGEGEGRSKTGTGGSRGGESARGKRQRQEGSGLEREEEVLEAVLAGRGMCHALLGRHDHALADYSRGVKLFPHNAELWRRRGLLQGGMGRRREAIEDISRSLDLDPTNHDALLQRGSLWFHSQDYWAAIDDFSTLLDTRPPDPLLFNALGLALAGAGEWRRAAEVFARGTALFPRAVQLWVEGGRAFKELGDVARAQDALERAVALEESTVAYHRLASLQHLTGDHRATIECVQRGLRGNPGDIELNHMQASAHHALGDFILALKQYDHVLSLSAGDTPGSFHVLQFMAFYQREIAAYTVLKLDAPFTAFRLDSHLDVKFREAWVKKLSPWTLFPGYNPIRLTESHLWTASRASLPSLSKQARALIAEADRIGQRTQYHVDGFFPNKRQYRMAGLAMLDIMQRVATTWQAMASATSAQDSSNLSSPAAPLGSAGEAVAPSPAQPESITSAPLISRVAATAVDAADASAAALPSKSSNGGSSRQRQRGADKGATHTAGSGGSSSGGMGDGGKGRRGRGSKGKDGGQGGGGLIGGWRELFNGIVRWRQIAEPADTVAWIDALKNEFETGFGSITAMTVGPTRNLKYYPLAHRALALMRARLLQTRMAANAAGSPLPVPPSRLPEIERARSVGEVHAVVGENFFVTTECHSVAFPGKVMNGTQLTLVESGSAFDFAIRTPVTPSRWKQFDAELAAAWRDLCGAVLDRALETADAARYRQRIQDNILRIGFYWYQFMPLTRGSAMVGLMAVLGLSMAAGMQTTSAMPRAMQVDWESILSPHFAAFNASVAPWLFAPATVHRAPWHLPLVADVLPSTRHIIAALSHHE